ncbi:purple acid phosphatase family protein [Planctomicrobium piriforme]|uniref:Calcineurin-like phosphoesterase n=1 Tax=Planctomicrobium piriforme TaxID=1576369 RepID=A0A1I3B4L8_9PLAN|nr:metallophosphoesterase family protein [Planctomicrobium piriforme]SFH57255.1 Calcineurin-like phosphoesterase [Planctomicrobium piriforme]
MSIRRRDFLGLSLAGFTAAATGFPARQQAVAGPEKIATGKFPAPLDTLFLTWQGDPTTTMTVQWVGPAPQAADVIYYAEWNTDVWQSARPHQKPYVNTDLSVSRCELTGLKPGTEYQFQVGNVGPVRRFRTMPAKATDTIQFVSGGDCGVNAHAVATNLIAARQEPWFALIGGDLAYDDGRKPEVFTQFLRNYSQHMIDPQGRLIPMITCIGNHEVNGAYGQPRSAAPQYLSLFDGLYRDTTYGVLDIGDYMSLVLLDTGHIASIAGEQTDWLQQTLADRQDCPHLIVANHVPAYPSYRGPNGNNGKPGTGELQRVNWCPLFERYQVDVVLEHHDHTFKRTHPLTNGMHDKHGVLYLGDGSWGQLRAPKEPEARPYLAKVSAAYHMTVHRLEGQERFHVALEESGKVADVCHTISKRPARRG